MGNRSVKRLEIGNVLIFTVGVKVYLEIVGSQALSQIVEQIISQMACENFRKNTEKYFYLKVFLLLYIFFYTFFLFVVNFLYCYILTLPNFIKNERQILIPRFA